MGSLQDLRGKAALVTGAARRLGRAIALGLAERGANVVVHYHRAAAEADDTVRRAAEYGVRSVALAADLAHSGQAAELLERAEAALGPIDVLVNNAATFGAGTLDSTRPEDWDQHLAVNLSAPFALAQAFGRRRSGRPGVVVNLLDWRALRPGADHFAYTVSKSALASMTLSLAAALAPAVRVNGLALGAILPPEEGGPAPDILTRIPLGRWGTPAEVVHAVIFLIAGSDFMTGSIVHLDGGRHLT